MTQPYTSPVADLLSYEQAQPVGASKWPDYVGELGLTAAHIPELLRLMQDLTLVDWHPEKEPAPLEGIDPDLAWCGPIHAWRALGQLQSPEFLQGATMVFNRGDLEEWALTEFSEVCQLIGPSVIEPLAEQIRAHLAAGNDAAAGLAEALAKLPDKYPEERDRCVQILQDALKTYPDNGPYNNTWLVYHLVELKAVEAIDLIAAAYRDKAVDEMLVGTWANAQIGLGLKTEADFTKAELTPEISPEILQVREMIDTLQRLNKPDAFELGMPVDPSTFPSTRPPEFDDLIQTQSAHPQDKQKGFGGGSKGKKKGKKKKK